MMKKVVGDEDVWYDKDVKDVVKTLYDSIAGDAGMNIEELERWLLKDWLEVQRKCAAEAAPMVLSERSQSRASVTMTDASTMTDCSETISVVPPPHVHIPTQSASPNSSRNSPTLLYASLGNGSKRTSTLQQIQGRIDMRKSQDRQRALAKARHLRADAQQATEAALKAQARAQRLTEMAAYANRAATEAEAEAGRYVNSIAADRRGQKLRLRLFQDREAREALTPPPAHRPSPINRIW